MKTSVFSTLAALALMGSTSVLSAATFDVNLVLDDFFVNRDDGARDRAVTVTGSIETNKSSGDLTAANLVSWSFSFTDGVDTYDLSDQTPGVVTAALNNRFDAFIDGDELKARDFIFFTHVNDGSTLLHNRFEYFTGSDKLVYTHSVTDLGTGAVSTGFVAHENDLASPFLLGAPPALSLAVRSIQDDTPQLSAVPLPAGAVLFGTALLGAGVAMRRRQRKA